MKKIIVTFTPVLTYSDLQTLIARRGELNSHGLFFEDSDMNKGELIFNLDPESATDRPAEQAKILALTINDFADFFRKILPDKETIEVIIE